MEGQLDAQQCVPPKNALAGTGNDASTALPTEEDLAAVAGAGQSYYQRSVLAILAAVQDVYGNILDGEERSLLAKLPTGPAGKSLSEDAQRLFFRLFLRKAGWLREARLEYRDIVSIRDAINELHAEGLVECALQTAEDVVSILQLDELRALARDLGVKATGQAVRSVGVKALIAPFSGRRGRDWLKKSYVVKDPNSSDSHSPLCRASPLRMKPTNAS